MSSLVIAGRRSALLTTSSRCGARRYGSRPRALGEHLDAAVIPPSGPVTSAVHTTAAGVRVGHEPPGCESRAGQVPPGKPDPADVQLTGDTWWELTQIAVQHVRPDVVDRDADRNRVPVEVRAHFVGQGSGRRFGQSVGVDDRDAGVRAPSPHGLRLGPPTAHDKQPQRLRDPRGALLDASGPLLPEAGGQIRRRDGLVVQEIGGASAGSSGHSTAQAPEASVGKIASIAVVHCRTRSSGHRSNRSRIADAWLASARCGTPTPGNPEVTTTAASSSSWGREWGWAESVTGMSTPFRRSPVVTTCRTSVSVPSMSR